MKEGLLRLDILVGNEWKEAYLPEDISIEIEEYSPLWNGRSSFSYDFPFPIEPNRHIIGNADDMRGMSIYAVLNNKRFRLWFDGEVFLSGRLRMDKSTDVDSPTVAVRLASEKREFDTMIEGVNAQDVEIHDHPRYPERNTQIGWCLPESISFGVGGDVKVYSPEFMTAKNMLNDSADVFVGVRHKKEVFSKKNVELGTGTVYMPKTLVPRCQDSSGEDLEDFTNISKPYPEARYCNIRLCTQKMYDDGTGKWEKDRGYHKMEADRAMSAPCFYVMWWVDLLMQDLGITITRNDMYTEPDMQRLAFVNVDAKYRDKYEMRAPLWDQRYDSEKDKKDNKVTTWFVLGDQLEVNIKLPGKYTNELYPMAEHFQSIGYTGTIELTRKLRMSALGELKNISAHYKESIDVKYLTWKMNLLHSAWATSENFPNVSASDILDALEKGFCMRFVYHSETSTMDVVFLRDILRKSTSQRINGDFGIPYKSEEDVRGVRLKYKSANEIKTNVFTKKKEYTQGGDETTYNYYDFRRATQKDYPDIIRDIQPNDLRLFLDPKTGNAYRIKVNGEASKSNELYPSLMEVMGYHDMEIGDCSEENKEYIEEVVIGFDPVIVNDVNFTDEREAILTGNKEDAVPCYAVFADCDIHATEKDGEVQKTKASVTWDNALMQVDSLRKAYTWEGLENPTDRKTISYDVLVQMLANETYDMSGDHPYEGVDFGLTLGILRDSTEKRDIYTYNDNYNGEGSKAWAMYSKSSGDFTSDSVDDYGRLLCEHDGKMGLSLKLQAEKKNPDTEEQYQISNECGRRGLYDRLHAEYMNWLLSRKKAVIPVLRISNHEFKQIGWFDRYSVLDINGFVNCKRYTLTQKGITDRQIEVYYV